MPRLPNNNFDAVNREPGGQPLHRSIGQRLKHRLTRLSLIPRSKQRHGDLGNRRVARRERDDAAEDVPHDFRRLSPIPRLEA